MSYLLILTPEQKRAFDDDGFLLLESFYSSPGNGGDAPPFPPVGHPHRRAPPKYALQFYGGARGVSARSF